MNTSKSAIPPMRFCGQDAYGKVFYLVVDVTGVHLFSRDMQPQFLSNEFKDAALLTFALSDIRDSGAAADVQQRQALAAIKSCANSPQTWEAATKLPPAPDGRDCYVAVYQGSGSTAWPIFVPSGAPRPDAGPLTAVVPGFQDGDTVEVYGPYAVPSF